jgi:hypothetical protein
MAYRSRDTRIPYFQQPLQVSKIRRPFIPACEQEAHEFGLNEIPWPKVRL